MKPVAVFILVSFLGLLSIGFTTMPSGSHHGHSDCVISAIDTTCTAQGANMAVHHVDAYNSFVNVLISIFTLFILAAAFFVVLALAQRSPQPIFVEEKIFTPQHTHLRRWLSLFINSPSFK